MWNIFKKRKKSDEESTALAVEIHEREDEDKDKSKETSTTAATCIVTTESARQSTQAAAKKFAKPDKYDRRLLDDGAAKRCAKMDAFSSSHDVIDPYTGKKLTLTKAEARQQYGKDWQKHLAEADHTVSLKERYKETKGEAWLTNEDIKASSNSSDNLEVVSREFNNPKRDRSNTDFVDDDEYLKKSGLKLSERGKAKARENERAARKSLARQDSAAKVRNIAGTFHTAGKSAAYNAGITCATMSGIMNITAVIKGDKTVEDALADTASDTIKASVSSYVAGGGLTVISHKLSYLPLSSSSKFVSALAKSNVPGNIITAVVLTGNTIKKYANGEINTQQCLLELGEKGLNFVTTGYAMTAGQVLIPIPIVGAAVGALVGSILTSGLFSELTARLQEKELEHQERLRIIAECKRASQAERKFREELEELINSYFKEYQACFDEALTMIDRSFSSGDADGVIAGANKITRKLGGKVSYDNMKEFENFLFDDIVDVL